MGSVLFFGPKSGPQNGGYLWEGTSPHHFLGLFRTMPSAGFKEGGIGSPPPMMGAKNRLAPSRLATWRFSSKADLKKNSTKMPIRFHQANQKVPIALPEFSFPTPVAASR